MHTNSWKERNKEVETVDGAWDKNGQKKINFRN